MAHPTWHPDSDLCDFVRYHKDRQPETHRVLHNISQSSRWFWRVLTKFGPLSLDAMQTPQTPTAPVNESQGHSRATPGPLQGHRLQMPKAFSATCQGLIPSWSWGFGWMVFVRKTTHRSKWMILTGVALWLRKPPSWYISHSSLPFACGFPIVTYNNYLLIKTQVETTTWQDFQ